MKKSATSAILVVLLVAALVVAVGVGSMGFKNWEVTSWFNNWGQGVSQPNNPNTPENPDISNNPDMPNLGEDMGNGGAVLSEIDSNGIALLSAELPVSAYSASGVSELAESAYVLTATITPENATNKSLLWSCNFKNSASSWASGKNCSDYISLTSSGNTATISCLQAFGEPIIVKVSSSANSAIFTTCQIDYAQRVAIKDTYFGNFKLNLDGTTQVPFVLGETGGLGGVVSVGLTSSSVYTIARDCKVSVSVGNIERLTVDTVYFSQLDTYTNLNGQEIYFDLRFFDLLAYRKTAIVNGLNKVYLWSDLFRADSKTYEPSNAVGTQIASFNVSLEDEYSSEIKTTKFVMSGYTIPLSSVNVDNSQIVF